MAELWRMAQGRLQAARGMLIAQAALVWCLDRMLPEDLTRFIKTGCLSPTGDPNRHKKIPYRPGLLTELSHGLKG